MHEYDLTLRVCGEGTCKCTLYRMYCVSRVIVSMQFVPATSFCITVVLYHQGNSLPRGRCTPTSKKRKGAEQHLATYLSCRRLKAGTAFTDRQ